MRSHGGTGSHAQPPLPERPEATKPLETLAEAEAGCARGWAYWPIAPLIGSIQLAKRIRCKSER